jgi:hypothetical protein
MASEARCAFGCVRAGRASAEPRPSWCVCMDPEDDGFMQRHRKKIRDLASAMAEAFEVLVLVAKSECGKNGFVCLLHCLSGKPDSL